jgi:hypothetical protein
METSSTFWLLDIANWWLQQEVTHSKYAELSNVAQDIFCIISHSVRVEASISLGRDVIGWRQSKTPGETHRQKVVIRLCARANNALPAGDDPELDLSSPVKDMVMKREVSKRSWTEWP